MFNRIRSAARNVASRVRSVANRITGRRGGSGRSSY